MGLRARIKKRSIQIDQVSVPMLIHFERRKSVRISIGKRQLNVRIPNFLTEKEQVLKIEWCIDWAKKKFKENPALLNRFREGSFYQTDDILRIQGEEFKLQIASFDKKGSSARLVNHTIKLRLSQWLEGIDREDIIRRLISRVLAKYFKPQIAAKVHDWNRRYFQKEIKDIKLKYNSSNWGSCSSKGNINLSTRLLLAPKEVMDYVIVHELAHLIEFNHSARFWKLVERALPDYKEKEKWLKEYGESCDF